MELFPTDAANPAFTADELRPLLREHWGRDGELLPLGSLQDQNYRLRTPDGELTVAKISGPHTPLETLELQDAALRHLAAQRPDFAAPVPVDARGGAGIVTSGEHRLRLLSWVAGEPLAERGYLGGVDLAGLGALAARLSAALEGFDHPGLAEPNGWDMRLSGATLAECRPQLPADWQAIVDAGLAAFEQVGADAPLPEAIVHGDLTPVNAVCAPGDELRSLPVGVLDFGDVMRSWRIGDLAVAAVGAIEHPGTGETLEAALAVLTGYHEVSPLTEAEAEAFWPLCLTRAAITAAVSQRQLDGNAGNVYAEQAVVSGLRAVHRLAAVPPALATAAVRLRLGLAAVPGRDARLAALAATPSAEVLPGLAPARVVDLSVDAPDFAYGEWLDADRLRELIGRAATDGATGATGAAAAAAAGTAADGAPAVAVGRWGEARLDAAPATGAPATLQLGVELFAPAGTPVHAPRAATVLDATGDTVLLGLAGVQLRVSGLHPAPLGAELAAGALLGEVAPSADLLPPRARLQLLLAPDLPATGLAAHRQAWQALCPDPSVLLGVDVAARDARDADALRREREQVVARPQHLYYDRPLEIVRGWRHHLYDADGRCYLDMINNIAAIGHSHPRVTEAAVRQFRRLNTNSRFLYDSMTRYAERIAALLPDGLDSVFLVNSGSEAADLALQLAQRYTGRRDVVALAGAYHGWTGSVIDISTSPMDRPNWRHELPSWVRVAEQPDTYRGAHGADADAYRASVREACAATSGGPAAFISEPLLGNQGALELPPGYLRGVYQDVRAAGGVCVADEVQVGMARTGDTFWAFEYEGAQPDVVFTAKATGNGHPLGVVVCRREIAETFDGQTAYFSSTGGGPVSCEIGLAVLDVLRDEGLQENARVVGAHLKGRLTELAERAPLIGAVHGRGLYQGIDLVLDRELRTPARFEALAVSERLRTAGVIMQPTGDAFNVLKVKPPMCLDLRAADYFVDALAGVLAEFT